MRALVLFVVSLAAVSVFAEQAQSSALQRAVVETALAHFGGVGHGETSALESSNIALADDTVGGNSDVMAQVASQFHGSAVADELITSYGANEQSERIPADDAYEIRLLRLDSFSLPDGSYDWDKLNSQYPDVKAIVKVSQPAVDSLGTVAIVRCEVITRQGFAWGAFAEVEKQSDGSWSATRSFVGDIRIAEPSPARAPLVSGGT